MATASQITADPALETQLFWDQYKTTIIAVAAVLVLGTRLEVEHTVDAVRHRVGGTVAATPFFNPKRKTALGSGVA